MKIELPVFATAKERNAYLIAKHDEIVTAKKSAIKVCDTIDLPATETELATKADLPEDTDGIIYRTIVGNTYLFMDSHDDVHDIDCFAESIASRTEKRISHLHDHIHQVTATVGKFKSVYEAQIKWKDLGIDKSGSTQALMADTAIDEKLNSTVFQMYKDGEINQHSVGMRYDEVLLAVNDPDEKSYYAVWNKYFKKLGNPEKAEKTGYFYVVVKASLIEISCVLNGSNELTPTLRRKMEASEETVETKRITSKSLL